MAFLSRVSPYLQPGRLLIGLSFLLPLFFFTVEAWWSYGEAQRSAENRVETIALLLREHALKVFETDQLVADNIQNWLNPEFDWTDSKRVDELEAELERLTQIPQITSIIMADDSGRLRASSLPKRREGTPVDYKDRDWFKELSSGALAPYISASYPGRLSNLPIFNFVQRFQTNGPQKVNGYIALSASRTYFETFYRDLAPGVAQDYRVMLVREDGAILAQYPAHPMAFLLPDSPLLTAMHQHAAGITVARTMIDGIERLFSFRRVEEYPVYVVFGVSTRSALVYWEHNLLGYGLVAAFASIALLIVSLLAIRQTRQIRDATIGWQLSAQQLQEEMARRGEAEHALLQAQKMEAVGQLTGGIAHDFNNMLTTIAGNLELMAHYLAKDAADRAASQPDGADRRSGDERLRRWCASALRGAERASILTRRLLSFSRQQTLEPQPVDANSSVMGMSDLLRRALPESVHFDIRADRDLWQILVDTNQLESAMLNLVINARDAMPDGGTVTIRTANCPADGEFGAPQPGASREDRVMISIEDNGIGMTAEVLAHACEPFYTTKPVGRGTGLGLSQVYGFVKQSQGVLTIESEPGEGVTIRLFFPRFLGEAAAAGLECDRAGSQERSAAL